MNVFRKDPRGAWRTAVRGQEVEDPARLDTLLAQGGLPSPSERKVMIRADRDAPYGRVQAVMNACARAGICRIECGASMKAGR